MATGILASGGVDLDTVFEPWQSGDQQISFDTGIIVGGQDIRYRYPDRFAGSAGFANDTGIITSGQDLSFWFARTGSVSRGAFTNLVWGPYSAEDTACSLTWKTDGTTDATTDMGTAAVQNWWSPTTSGKGNSYYIKFVRYLGTTTYSGMSNNTWYALSSNRTLTLTATSSKYLYFRVAISTAGSDATIVAQSPAANSCYMETWILGNDPCVFVESFMPLTSKRAGELKEGDYLYVLTPEYSGYEMNTIQEHKVTPALCVRLIAENGNSLIVSWNTPVTQQDGSTVKACNSLGASIAYLTGDEFGWTKIVEVQDVGELPVAQISVFNKTYAAGEVDGRYLFTHNQKG